MRYRLSLLLPLLVLLAACPPPGNTINFELPNDGWRLYPKKENLDPGTVGPANQTNGTVHIGNDKTSGKKGDKASSAEKTIKCEGEGAYCTVLFHIVFAAPTDSKDRLKITYWGSDGTKKSVSAKPHVPLDSQRDYKLSVSGACKELHVKVEIDTDDASLGSHADVKISAIPPPTCTKEDETNSTGEAGGHFAD